MVQSYKCGRANVCLNISGQFRAGTQNFFITLSRFLRCFRDTIRDPRIENRVPRIREDYLRVPRIRETGSLQFIPGS